MAIEPVKVGVEATHREFDKHAKQWKRTRDAIAGQDTIHAGGKTYLPELKEEDTDDYKARMARTPFYNATWRTVSALHGMLFRKEPAVAMAEGLKPYLLDVTQSGKPFSVFAEEVGLERVEVGRAGVLVDHPPAPPAPEGRSLNKQEAEKLGLKPKMSLYKTESIFNWRYTNINNTWTLCQVRLKETYAKDEADEFSDVELEQIRVLDLDPKAGFTYRQRVYRQVNGAGEWTQHGTDIVPLMNGKPLTFIPFEFIGKAEEPPMLDLVNMNLQHYMVESDYQHACHMTALPTPWVAGVSDKVDDAGKAVPTKLYIGSGAAWVFSSSETKVGFLEYTGQGIDAIKENLVQIEAQMAAIGARMLAPEKSGVEASDTLAMRHSGEQSVLAQIGLSCSLGLTRVLTWYAQWCGVTGEVSCVLNKEYMPVNMDPATLTALMSAWQQGAISEADLFAKLQQGDVIRSDKTLEEHQGEIESAPPMGVQTAKASLDALENPPVDDKKKPAPKAK